MGWGVRSTPLLPLGPTSLVRGLEWWTRMEKNVAKQNISDAIIITPYAQNKIPSKRFALNFVKENELQTVQNYFLHLQIWPIDFNGKL